MTDEIQFSLQKSEKKLKPKYESWSEFDTEQKWDIFRTKNEQFFNNFLKQVSNSFGTTFEQNASILQNPPFLLCLDFFVKQQKWATPKSSDKWGSSHFMLISVFSLFLSLSYLCMFFHIPCSSLFLYKFFSPFLYLFLFLLYLPLFPCLPLPLFLSLLFSLSLSSSPLLSFTILPLYLYLPLFYSLPFSLLPSHSFSFFFSLSLFTSLFFSPSYLFPILNSPYCLSLLLILILFLSLFLCVYNFFLFSLSLFATFESDFSFPLSFIISPMGFGVTFIQMLLPFYVFLIPEFYFWLVYLCICYFFSFYFHVFYKMNMKGGNS